MTTALPRYRALTFGVTRGLRRDAPDGTTYLQAEQPLAPHAHRLTDRLVHWATVAPQRSFMARRERLADGRTGDWQHLSYADALDAARRIGQALLDRGLNAERPVLIVSENDLEHAQLALGCLYAGIPWAPASPAYSLVSQDFEKLRHIVTTLTPGLVFAADAPRYERALMADDLLQTLDSLHINSVNLLGHSMGGKLAMAFALAQPQRVSKLVLADIAPVAYPARHNTIFAGLNAVDLTAISSRNEADAKLADYIDEPSVRQFLLKSLLKQDDKFSWRFNLAALQKNYQQLIGAPLVNGCYNGPTLFIKGGESDYKLPEHKAQIMQLFPQAQAKVIQGTGHWLHAEKPAVFTKLVKDFLLS